MVTLWVFLGGVRTTHKALFTYRSVSGGLSVLMGKTQVDHNCCDVTRPEVMLWVSVITAGIDAGPELICGLIL
jgi:hypothetical protein